MRVPTASLLVVLALLAVARPAQAELATPKVIGGEAVPNGMFPFLVGLLREENLESGQPSCTGSLIRPQWILTAAHCGEPAEVLISDRKPGTLGPDHVMWSIPVIEWIPHPEFDDTVYPFDNDVALVHIGLNAGDFPPTLDDIPLYKPEPVALATGPGTTNNPIGDVIIAGFGYTDPNEVLPPPSAAHWANQVPTAGVAGCDVPNLSPSENLCYGPSPNTCAGDSGGPIFQSRGARFYQVAVTSVGVAGAPCASYQDAGMWVPSYLDWINETISPRDASPITLGWELPIDRADGVSSGISNGQGWTFSSAGSIVSVQLFINGRLEATLPCCSERGDAPGPELSGFSGAINWGRFSPGIHQATLVVRDSVGNQKIERRVIETISILPPNQFLRELSFDAASCTTGGAELACTDITFAEGTCPGEIRFRWTSSKQAMEVSRGCAS